MANYSPKQSPFYSDCIGFNRTIQHKGMKVYFPTQMCSSKLLLSVTEGHGAVLQETYGQVPMTVICWSGRQEWLLTQIAKQSKIESQLMHSLSHRLNELHPIICLCFGEMEQNRAFGGKCPICGCGVD